MSSNMATTRLCQLKQLYPGLLLCWGHGLELIHKPKPWGRSDLLLFLDVCALSLYCLFLWPFLLNCLPLLWLGSWPGRFWRRPRHGLGSRGLLPLAEDDEIDAIDPIGAVAMGPIDRGGGRPGGGAASVDLPRWNLMLASGHTSLHRFRALSRLCSKSSSVQATPVKSSWRFWVRVRMFLSNTEPWQGPTSRWMSQLRQLNQLKTLQDYCHWINWGNSIGTNVDG